MALNLGTLRDAPHGAYPCSRPGGDFRCGKDVISRSPIGPTNRSPSYVTALSEIFGRIAGRAYQPIPMMFPEFGRNAAEVGVFLPAPIVLIPVQR